MIKFFILLITLPSLCFAADTNPYVQKMIEAKQREAERQRMEMEEKIQHRQQNPYAYMQKYDDEQKGSDKVSFSAANDGHFYVPAQIDGRSVNFLADTGASAVFLTQEDARAVGVNVSNLNYNIPVQTANGNAYVAATTVKNIKVGPISTGSTQVAVAQKPGGISLLGMDFFSQLKKYDVEDGKLTLYK